MNNMMAVIMAGGRGHRMGLLCDSRPKPILPFGGKYRVIDFCLSNCINSQISQVMVLADYHSSDLRNYLNIWRSSQTSDCDQMHILEPQSGNYLGTADALYQNLDLIRESDAADILILAADHIYKMDYREMMSFHRNKRADVTVAVTPVPIVEAYRFGIVTINDSKAIIKFNEKPVIPMSTLASMGIYIFNKKILIEALVRDASDTRSQHDFGKTILPGLVDTGNVFAFKFDKYWRDIGTVRSYYDANKEFIKQEVLFATDKTWPILNSNEHRLPSGEFCISSTIKHSVISPGCVIKGCVENSVISPGVWIEEKAVVRNSIIMPNTFIGYHSVVDNAIIDEDVMIDKFCYVGFKGADVFHDLPITILGSAINVPRYTAIISGSELPPNSRLLKSTANVIIAHDEPLSLDKELVDYGTRAETKNE